MTLDELDHPDAELTPEDKKFLQEFDQDAEDRAAIEDLQNSTELWEIDPTGEDDD
jgi:hypothetical protein